MKIYTRTGDKGTTALYGGRRVSKADLLIEVIGSLDEFCSFIGIIIAKTKNHFQQKFLTITQKNLYQIMGFLTGANINIKNLSKETEKIEKQIDEAEKKLPKLHSFILPQGGELASFYHIARSLCRRAERNVVKIFSSSAKTSKQLLIIAYLNRLSDLLFCWARLSSKNEIQV